MKLSEKILCTAFFIIAIVSIILAFNCFNLDTYSGTYVTKKLTTASIMWQTIYVPQEKQSQI